MSQLSWAKPNPSLFKRGSIVTYFIGYMFLYYKFLMLQPYLY